eukprot:CAMPEP_0181522814 /NCGR_PEP_ID=MMETSP1110-20121109/67574_1 /TAXON_ID=174948 /ORGANISM="Symbiodinium sp., Strain CCMP421" /LENGTH=126 /DNA_ID=CAMNT_0023653455 /DNA_START=1 /DNA_END=378 /DNA_ORIENTATION=-
MAASQLARQLAAKADLTDEEMLNLNKALLDLIMAGDFDTYKFICDDKMSCFEPEAKGHMVTGLDFHKYYFDLQQDSGSGKKEARNTSLVAPHLRWHCNRQAATVCFKRLVQAGVNTIATEETRVWE